MNDNLTPEEIRTLKQFASSRERDRHFARRLALPVLIFGALIITGSILIPGPVIGVGSSPFVLPAIIVGVLLIIVSALVIMFSKK